MTEEIQLPGDVIQWGEDDLHNAMHRKDIEIFQMRKQIDVLVSARNDYFTALTGCQQRSVQAENENAELKAHVQTLQAQIRHTDAAAAQQRLTDAELEAHRLIADDSVSKHEATPLAPIDRIIGPDRDAAPELPRLGPSYETGPADASTVAQQGGDKIAPLQSAAAEVDAIAEQQVIAPIPILRPREKQP